MKRTTTVLGTAVLAAGLATAAFAPNAAANPNYVSNANNTVRCYMTEGETLCVSDIGRDAQPECNPPGHLIPAVSIQRNWVGTKCWNQGFDGQPMRLNPLQIHVNGSRVVIPGLAGELYVLDVAKPALVRAGAHNAVLFAL